MKKLSEKQLRFNRGIIGYKNDKKGIYFSSTNNYLIPVESIKDWAKECIKELEKKQKLVEKHSNNGYGKTEMLTYEFIRLQGKIEFLKEFILEEKE